MGAAAGILGFVALFALMAVNMPIGFSMAFIGFIGYALLVNWQASLAQLALAPFATVASYTMSIIPLFLLMGEFANESGIVARAYYAAHKWFGHIHGGLAVATITACAIFAAVSSSSMACASVMTSVAYPEMKRYKYDEKLSLGSIAAGGTLGILIPPSTVFIVYALFSDASVGRLLMAGVLPGILLSLLFIIYIYIRTKITPTMGPPTPKATWRERLVSFKDIIPISILILLVLGGLWGGIFTANEAAGIGALGALLVAIGSRTFSFKKAISALSLSAKTTGSLFFLIIGAMVFNYFIVATGLPTTLAKFVETLPLPSIGILIAILIVYLVLGCIMDSFAMTVLTLPIFIPIISNLGYDLVWFGVLYVIMIEAGLITPPIGMNVFVVGGMVREVPMEKIFMGIVPFLAAMIVCIIILIVFPQFALILPNAMIRR